MGENIKPLLDIMREQGRLDLPDVDRPPFLVEILSRCVCGVVTAEHSLRHDGKEMTVYTLDCDEMRKKGRPDRNYNVTGEQLQLGDRVYAYVTRRPDIIQTGGIGIEAYAIKWMRLVHRDDA